MAKLLPVQYIPSTPPVRFEAWPRWIDEELHRIAASLTENPVIVTVEGSGVIVIDNVLNTVRLGVGDVAIFDYPDGSWNPTLGEYTISLDGIYMANVQAFIEPFGGGNKSYFAQLEIFVNTVSRSIQADGGSDDVPLGVTINAPMLLLSGDVVYFELSTLHEQFTGVSGYQYKISMTRSASV